MNFGAPQKLKWLQIFLNPEKGFKNVSIVTFPCIFNISLRNNLFIFLTFLFL